MYTPTPEAAAQMFGLGRPVGELQPVRSGDTDTWRLDTVDGSYFVKGYRSSTSGQFVAGGLTDQLEVAMAFERLALEAGVDMAAPISPAAPLVGWVTRAEGRLFRAYDWIEHRKLGPGDDIADWLGRMMAQVHRIGPRKQSGLPAWWRGAVHPRETWEEWFAEARLRERPWSDLAQERLAYILDMSARIDELCASAPDCVTTHGDFKTHNLVMAPTGPILVDWDSVRTDSAALEAGRVAYIFGAGELEPIRRILKAYVAAGGDLTWTGQNLFLSVARHDLDGLSARVRASLGQLPRAWWMGDGVAVEDSIAELLRELPGRFEQLDHLAAHR